jgi:hypothetical protein
MNSSSTSRLNRARSLEDAMLSLGHFEAAGEIDTEHPQVHAALTAARVFRGDSQSFPNLSLYEQRLERNLDKSLRELQTLQAERRAAQQKEAADAEVPRNHNKIEDKPFVAARGSVAEGFVFSSSDCKPEAGGRFELPTFQNLAKHASDPESLCDKLVLIQSHKEYIMGEVTFA